MSEQMARSKANDKSDPANFPEDNGLRECKECGEDIKVDLTNAKEAEIEEFINCYAHLKDIESLREECSNRVRSIHGLTKDLRKERNEMVSSLNERISHLESQVRYRDGHIEELTAALTKAQEQFDRMNQLVQAYDKLLKA